MKKILTKIALVSALISSAQAGAVLDLEVGGGMWATSAPTGALELSPLGDMNFATDASLSSTSDNTYMWAVIDHPIPIVPNLRIEQTTLKSAGSTTLYDTDLDMSHTDFIAYWGVPFSTWLPFIDELDFGLGVKAFNGSFTMVNDTTSIETTQSFDGAALPYGYAKLRVKPPFMMGVGIEAELKYLNIDAGSVISNFTETIIKLDWGIEAPLPVLDIEAGVELGYRMMSFDVEVSDLKGDVEFNGVFFGVYGKFGI